MTALNWAKYTPAKDIIKACGPSSSLCITLSGSNAFGQFAPISSPIFTFGFKFNRSLITSRYFHFAIWSGFTTSLSTVSSLLAWVLAKDFHLYFWVNLSNPFAACNPSIVVICANATPLMVLTVVVVFFLKSEYHQPIHEGPLTAAVQHWICLQYFVLSIFDSYIKYLHPYIIFDPNIRTSVRWIPRNFLTFFITIAYNCGVVGVTDWCIILTIPTFTAAGLLN